MAFLAKFKQPTVVAAITAAILWPPVCMRLTEAATPSQAVSIGESFDLFWKAAHSLPFQQQEAVWNKFIEEPRQDLYATVIWGTKEHRDWRERKDQLLRQRFLEYPQLSAQIPQLSYALQSDMPIYATRFRKLFADAAARPPFELALAPNFDAKSGVLADGTPVLVFAVDSLLIEHADISVIFPHELFHLYHAGHAGIENDGVMPGVDLTLPLFAEGLATYVSSVLSSGHSDGQLLLQNDLGKLPLDKLPTIATRFLADADNRTMLEGEESESFGRWFNGSTTERQAGLPNRTGYWLGLHVIRKMRTKYSLHELASWAPSQAQAHTRATLIEIATSRNYLRDNGR